ncbi:transposase [Bacillus sp. FJAT-27264]|uniref:IS256 family transposase n=1 Tax=Paenibacillus sp. (strain DSM 101736 / FJAT-27264) TaxID=1850362 RepID=UPI000807A50A|nr:IS256 family transposase [Bacillus sp. FJAT-27264]OBZ07950.1 transposase [Bacillus sp. FJAT-27264]OBZ10768.1 transposase [Bacillus sp. FJAT-27264]OBZ11565.1 transposase [Bacillus sp. FJAT-27264]OBZ11642.1 transposase [Bacillus sp. FJAT-27264]OBZ14851.1 transposase [Bacillus sp. FJAT-27264]
MTILPENMLNNLFENLVTQFVKDNLESIMKAEIQQFMEVEQAGERNSRNGYYKRGLHTKYGNLEDLEVPRDRNGAFQTQMFEPYQRRDGWLEEAVIQMYKSGMGTRDVARFIESMFGSHYSPTTVSNITATVLDDIHQWQKRPLQKRYSVIYLDGLYVKLKRSTVSGEVVYFAMGIDEEGHRQILGFYVGGQESSNGWREVLKDLYNRGVQEVLLGVFDGLPRLDEAFREIYPEADVQHCIVHKVRSTFPKIRVQHKTEVIEDLKTIYTAEDHDLALAAFDTVKAKWGKIYPKEMDSWEEQLSTLLTFHKYPALIKEAIYTSNPIERMNKEIRKRLKPMNSLTNMDAAEKIIYLNVMDYNERFAERVIRGFGDPKVKEKLNEMFEARYGVRKELEK